MEIKLKLFLNFLLIILTNFPTLCYCDSSESFQAVSVFVLDTTVSKQTTFGIQLFLNTQRVVNQDYLIINLPTGVTFRTTTTPTCSFTSLTVSACTIVSSTSARISFTTSSSLSSIEGQISNFINPDSVRTINNIEINLYSGTLNTIKVSTQGASLSNFQPATLTATVASSSIIVGATDVQLKVNITPSTMIKAQGRIIITVPQYYTNAGSSYMIGGSSPICTATITSQTVTISSCSFSGASLQLTVVYSLSLGTDSSSTMQLTIQSSKNPISTQTKQGYYAQTQDTNGYQIEQSAPLTLSGITTAASFSSYTLTLIDSSIVQTYTGIQFKLSLALPIEQGCYLKFIFPSDFTIDDKMTSIQGSGFFKPSATSSTVTWLSKDTSTKTIIIPACQYLYGPDQAGIITFNQIQNPAQVKTTSQIQIFMAKDSTFSVNIAQITTTANFVASSSLFTYGSINSISVLAVDSNYIQTDTNYSISFTPQHNLPQSGTIIVITFPSLITLSSSGCSITQKNSRFDSSSISCSISSPNVTITNPFATDYTGSTQLQLALSKGTNPQSERSAGTFTISTYIRISSVNYLVDQGTSADNLIIPVGGQITKASDIVVIDAITYMDDQTYQFSLYFTHLVPYNGYLNFTVPTECSISSHSLVTNKCKRLDTNKNMNCQVVDDNQVQIHIDSKAFTSDGIPSSSIFSFSVAGIKNPRTTQQTSIFYFSSYDSDFMRIDSSTSNDYFIATMTDVSEITSISVDNANKSNYATTNYTFTITPNTPIFQNDYLQLTFPTEIKLPDVSNLICSVDQSQTVLTQVQCQKLGSSIIQINLIKTSSIISAQQPFSFIIYNVQNQISTKPTSPFTNIIMGTSSGYLISKYSKNDITVSTNISSYIQTRKLTQSNKNPNEEATFTITFTTSNALPTTTAILITAPSIIKLMNNLTGCFVALTSIVRDVCTINQTLIRVENAFATQGSTYFGEVSIIFQALNPGDNSNLQSIILRTYTDNTYQYRINRIESGLIPTLECNFPCKRCDQNNPDFCTDCFSENTFPQFIQQEDAKQTCVYECSSGHSSNGSKNPKVCTKCDSKCSQCYQDDKVGDINKCMECANDYPFYFSPNITCQNQCFDNQYQCKAKECCECQAPCKTCAGPVTCRSCNQNSDKPLLWIDKCVATCPTGFTQVGMDCIKCTSPCATCLNGVPSACLTCDGKLGQQLLFGRTCVSQCPSGTTPQFSNVTQSKCTGCVTGCLSCDQINNAICLKCAVGLALFRDECWTECPFNYVKSKDGTACELRTYLLDQSLVYFPFGIAACAVLIITLAAFIISKQKSLILSNAIALLGLVEWTALIYQTYSAYTYTINYTIITLSSLGILCALFLLNLAFVIFYCARIQFSDIAYNYWRQKYSCTTIFVLFLSLLMNFKLYRMLYSRFFGLEFLSANIDDKVAFSKKIQVFSIISIFTFTLPLVVIDTLVVIYLGWGSQLYITCIESGIISAIGALMIAIDNCCMCSRLSYQEEKELQKQKRKTREIYSKLDQSKDVLVMGGAPDDEESKLEGIKERESALKTIINQIRNNKDLRINNHFDTLLVTHHSDSEDEEINPQDKFDKLFLRKVNSMQNLQVKQSREVQKGEDERQTKSISSLSPPPLKGMKYSDNNLKTASIFSPEKKKLLKSKLIMQQLQSEYRYDNVYAESVDPQPPQPLNAQPIKPEMNDSEIQTDDNLIIKFKKSNSPSSSLAHRSTNKRIMDDLPGENSIDSYDNDDSTLRRRRARKKNKQRGKSKNPYYTQINEEDQEDEDRLSLGDEEDTQREFLKTAYEQDNEEDDEEGIGRNGGGSGSRRNIQGSRNSKQRRSQNNGTSAGGDMRSRQSRKGGTQHQQSVKTNKSRSSGMMKSFSNHTNNQNQQDLLLSLNLSETNGKLQFDQKQLDLLQNQYEQEYFNQRTFNLNSILGDFVRTWKGTLLNKREQVASLNHRDMRGRPVNSYGYLIDQQGGFILNRDNLNLMFRREQLVAGNNSSGDGGQEVYEQIPMPYKFERWNFNPHEIMGNFDYENTSSGSGSGVMKPVILKNKQGQLVDKHLRPVNQSGFLIDEHENIIDNQGRVKFIREQLNELGDLPQLFNYKGKSFDIRSIIGIFSRDPNSKQILVNTDPQDHSIQTDKLGRRINTTGYLMDRMGNIVNTHSKIVFFKSQLMFNEPPKFFPFMKFDLSKILGNLHFNLQNSGYPYPVFNKDQIDEDIEGKGGAAVMLYDLEGRRVNNCGYLIDDEGNVIDRYGCVCIRRELLELDENKRPTQIPLVFRNGSFYDKAKQLQAQDNLDHNVFDQSLLNHNLNQSSSHDLQSKLEQIQSQNKLALMNDGLQDIEAYQQQPLQNAIVDIQIPFTTNHNQLSHSSNNPFNNKNDLQEEDIQASLNIQDDNGIGGDLMSDDGVPEPLMHKIKDIPTGNTKKKRKQSAGGAYKGKQQQRQGEKVLNAYSISRPISSYLPAQYQQRAKSQAKQRSSNNNQTGMMMHGDYSNSNIMNANTRLQSFNVTSQIQSNSSDIFKKNAISALGFTEDFSKQNTQAPRVMKNQYINSVSDDPSYNNFLEGADPSVNNQQEGTQAYQQNFNWHHNQSQIQYQNPQKNNKTSFQNQAATSTFTNPNHNLPKQQQQQHQLNNPNHHHNHHRIQQNESQLDKLYAEEVSRYIDQSDDEDEEEIYNYGEENPNFIYDNNQHQMSNFQKLGNQQKLHQKSKIKLLNPRSSSQQRGTSKLKMYEKGSRKASINDLRLDSQGSNDSQLSRKGPAILQRSRKQLKVMDQKLKGLEHIYLQDFSAKNANSLMSSKGVSSNNLKNMSDKYYDRDMESQQQQYNGGNNLLGRRNIDNYN